MPVPTRLATSPGTVQDRGRRRRSGIARASICDDPIAADMAAERLAVGRGTRPDGRAGIRTQGRSRCRPPADDGGGKDSRSVASCVVRRVGAVAA